MKRRFMVKATGWPWQGYGWFPHRNGRGPRAMLNPHGSRFGGGWNYKLGIQWGANSIIIDLLFGSIRINRV